MEHISRSDRASTSSVTGGGQPFVYLADSSGNGSVAKQRAISLGDTIGNDYAVTEGLKAGDKVIVSGTQFLVDGMPVRPIS